MNADHNSTQRQLFLKDYAEVIPIIIGLRNDGYSLPEIARDLNSRGFMTRENKSFSHVQVLRILQRVSANSTQPARQDSMQNDLLDSQVQSEVAQLKSEICTLKRQYEELQTEMSEMKAQLSELKEENQQLKTDFVKLTSAQSCSVQGVQDNPIESMPRQSTEPARQIIDGEIKKAILQQANQLHAENSELSKSHIAKMLSEKFNVRMETARDWLKKMW